MSWVASFFFFKQKTAYEIGGVQTCALPIYATPMVTAIMRAVTIGVASPQIEIQLRGDLPHRPNLRFAKHRFSNRSEERRVGKECRTPWYAQLQDKKIKCCK